MAGVHWTMRGGTLLLVFLLAAALAIKTSNRQHLDLLPTDCGRRQISRKDSTRPFILGSGNTTAYYGQYPWQARLLKYELNQGAYVHQCGAVVVTGRHVLTAAHCVQHLAPSNMLIRVGELRLGRADEESARREYGVSGVRIHYRYTGAAGLPDDIALLRLRLPPGEQLQFSAYVTPACLPAQGAEYETNLACEVSGWGRVTSHGPISQTLRGVEVPVISDEFCASPEIYQDRFVATKMFCAGLTLGGSDACEGDSGGPLACEQDGRFIAYGLVSSGDPLGCGRRPGLYTRVENYMDWMLRRLAVDAEDEALELLSASQCGVVNFQPPSHTGAGYVESNRNFPWMVRVIANNSATCGGVIVSPRWVLTGFLCGSAGGENKIVVADVATSNTLLELKVDRVEKQPRRSTNNEPAFALLHTTEPIPFSDSVSPICLPEDTSLAPVRPNVDLIFVGWGAPKFVVKNSSIKLKWARLRVTDLSECKANYSEALGSDRTMKFFNDDTFCTQFLEKNNEFSCGVGPGDTGGVFMDRVYNGRHVKWRVLGTAVSGLGCGQEKYPDINAALGPALRWFRSIVDGALS